MPTAAEHRTEASSLADALDTIRTIRSDLLHDRDDLGVRGASSLLVGWTLDASVGDLDELGRLGTLLVDELHRRAALCDQYTVEVRRYEDAHRRWLAALYRHRATADTADPARWPGTEPLPPAPPFPGAVAG